MRAKKGNDAARDAARRSPRRKAQGYGGQQAQPAAHSAEPATKRSRRASGGAQALHAERDRHAPAAAPASLPDDLLIGRNAVTEALRAGTPIDKIYLARGETDAALGHIASTARSKGVVVVECDRRKLDGMSRTHSHQGVIALCAVREYVTVDDILALDAEARIRVRDSMNGRGV